MALSHPRLYSSLTLHPLMTLCHPLGFTPALQVECWNHTCFFLINPFKTVDFLLALEVPRVQFQMRTLPLATVCLITTLDLVLVVPVKTKIRWSIICEQWVSGLSWENFLSTNVGGLDLWEKSMRYQLSFPPAQSEKVRSSCDQLSSQGNISCGSLSELKDPQGMACPPRCWISTVDKT